MPLTPLIQAFVLHFGEMGSRWGMNRTVGQIYALLYVSPEPLHAEQIAEALGFSRSNVSMGLKELASWRLVRLRHLPGDRREYFSAPDDIWSILRTLAEERRRRELDPTLTMLRGALMEPPANDAEAHAQQRMREMHDAVDLVSGWFDEIRSLDDRTLVGLMRLGTRVARVLEAKNRLATGAAAGAARLTGGRAAKEKDRG